MRSQGSISDPWTLFRDILSSSQRLRVISVMQISVDDAMLATAPGRGTSSGVETVQKASCAPAVIQVSSLSCYAEVIENSVVQIWA